MPPSKQKELQSLLDDAHQLFRGWASQCIEQNASLLDSAALLLEEDKKSNEQDSHRFNPLRYYHIDETKHSLILKDILDPKGAHGQGNKFLHLFLKQLDYDDSWMEKEWFVTAEKDRVDVQLVCPAANGRIIIENKIHSAIDQPNQLYRYWYYQIWSTSRRELFQPETKDLPKQFRIIYLTKDGTKWPDKQSYERPNEKFDWENIPDDWVCKRSFKELIAGWIKQCITSLPESNYRYKIFLEQYLEIIS